VFILLNVNIILLIVKNTLHLIKYKLIIMVHKLLLPNKFKLIGWILLILTFISHAILRIYGTIHYTDIMLPRQLNFIPNTLIPVLFIIGGLCVGFSKEKKEDEFIAELRLSSLLWAVLVNYILLIFAFIFIYGMDFFDVMGYNMFTVLIIFIARFNYLLYKNSKIVSDEK